MSRLGSGVRPTVRGTAIIVLGTLVYLAARLIGTWELYVLAFAFLAAALVSWLLVLVTTRTLAITRSIHPKHPIAGDNVLFTYRLSNGSSLPGLQVTIPDALGGLDPYRRGVDFQSLGPRAVRVASTVPQRARRGIHHVPPMRMEAEDPLGLFRSRRLVGEPLDVIVYPRLARLETCVLSGETGVRAQWGKYGLRSLGAAEFRGIRPHHPGEPLSRVAWKATARTGSLMLREMDDSTSSDVNVLLDGTAASIVGEAGDTNFELAVRAAGTIADFALRSGRAVNLLFHDREWRQTRLSPYGDGHRRLLEKLAEAAGDAPTPLRHSLQKLRAGAGQLMRAQTMVLIALSLDQELTRALVALRDHGLQVSVVGIDAGSYSTAAASHAISVTERARLLSLAHAGVLCVTLARGDDLRAVLSWRSVEQEQEPEPLMR